MLNNIWRKMFLSIQSRDDDFFSILAYGVPALLSIFIFLKPYPHTTSYTNIAFYLSVLITLVLIIFKRISFKVKTPLTWAFAFFFLWSCLSLIWALNAENSLNDVRGHLLNHLVFFFLIVNFFNSRKRLEMLAWIIIISAVVFSFAGMIYYYVIMDFGLTEVRLGGLLPDNRHVYMELRGNFIGTLSIPALLFCLFFYRQNVLLWQRCAILICAALILIATLLTISSGILVALVLAGIALSLMKNKKYLSFFLIGLVLVIAFSLFKSSRDTFSFLERLKINYVTMQVIKDYPLFGIGFGMRTFSDNLDIPAYVAKVPKNYRPEAIVTPHNWLLDIVVRLGLIGLALFMLILYTFIRMCWRIIRHARDGIIREWGIYVAIAFLSYFVLGLTEPVFLYKVSAMVFYILMAMITILWLLNHDDAVGQ